MNNQNNKVINFYSNGDDLVMKDYKINVIFNNNNNSLEDIFTKVLLKELLMILKNENNMIDSSCTYLSLNQKGGKN